MSDTPDDTLRDDVCWWTPLRFVANDFMAKKNCNGDMVCYDNSIEFKDHGVLPVRFVPDFIEWLKLAFPQETKHE